jgi:hypothetical protein
VAAFATVDELAEYTRKAIDSDAAVVSASRLLDVASAAIRSYCRQSFDLVTGDVVVLDDPAGLPGVLLPELPVLAVTSVETLSDGTWTALAADGFEWDSYGRVWLTGKAPVWWPRLTRSVRVTYNHGYASVPEDVKAVCLALAGRLYTNPLGLVSESIGNYAVRYENNRAAGVAFSDFELAILGNYRLVTVA